MKQFLRGIFPVALALISSLAHAQNDYWVNTGSGDFNTAANWSTQPPLSGIQGTSEVPNAGNIAVITPQGNSLIITQTNATNTIRGLEVNNSNGIFFFATGGTVTFTSASSTLTVNGVTNVAGEGDFAAADFFVDQGTDLVFNSPSNNGQLLVTNGRISIGDNLAPFAPTTGELDVNSGLVSFNPGLNSKTEVNIGDGLGASGTVTQGLAASSTSGALSSTVVTGNWFYIGLGGGDGSYSLVNNSILQTGTVNGSTAIIGLGVNSTSNTFLGGFGGGATGPGSTGNMTINDSSVVNIGNSTGTSKGDLQLGTTSVGSVLGGGSGTITQSGTGSAVNIFGGSSMEIGNSPGGTGSYNLAAGILNIGVAGTGVATLTVANNGAIGSLVQTGGTLVAGANSLVAIGKGTGTATYALTGGTANFENGFTLAGAGSSISQSGSTTLTAEGAVTLGGTSTYFMNGGSAIFSNTVDIATGASLGVNGGTFQVGEDNLEGVGDINYGGGTLKITTDSGLGTTLAYGFGGGVLSNGVSTIDASTSNLTAFNLANPFSGTGGISFIGNGGTVFQFTNDATNPNSYTGSTAINGGTLIVNGSDIANSSSLGIGSTGTLKLNLSNLAANATFDYAGSISGTGTLDVGFFNPGDTLALTNPTPGATSFTGNIVLGYNGTGGTLNIFNGTYGAISDDGTGSSVTIGTTTNSGIVNFTGPSTYTGTTTVFANYSLTALNLDGNVVNAGTLDVTGAAGINAGAGGLITNSGTLTSSAIVGNVGTSLANGNSGTLFTSSVSGNLFNSGTLSSTATLGTTPGVATVTIGGGLTSSGTLTFRDAGTVADLYDVTGAANLTGGGGSITGYGTTPAAGLTVLTSAATTGFTAGNYKVAGPGVLFTGEVTQVGNNLVLHTTENPAAPFAQTSNQLAVANAIDPALTNNGLPGNLYLALNALGANQIPGVLDELSPEVLQYSREIAFENATFLVQKVDSDLANVRMGYSGIDASGFSVVSNGFTSDLGRSLNSLLAYDPPSFDQAAPNGVNYYPQPNGYSPQTAAPSASESSYSTPATVSDMPNPDTTVSPSTLAPSEANFKGPSTSGFIVGNVVLADMNQDLNQPNAPPSKGNYTTGSATAGINFRMTNNLAAGVLFDYNHTSANTDSLNSKTTVNTYSPGIYATWFDKGFYANGLFSFGYNNYSNNRVVPFFGTTANSSPSGEQYVANIDGGYDFQPKHHHEWIFGPTLGLTYTHLDIDSFIETGGGPADLSVNSQSADSLRSNLGGHVIYQARAGDLLFQPNLSLIWQHEFLDNNSSITSQFNIPGTTPFTINTADFGEDSVLIEPGVTVTLSNSMAFYLNYVADVGTEDFFAQSIVGGFKASF